LFGHNNNIFGKEKIWKINAPGKARANLAPTPVPSPDQKKIIKKWAIWYKTFLPF